MLVLFGVHYQSRMGRIDASCLKSVDVVILHIMPGGLIAFIRAAT